MFTILGSYWWEFYKHGLWLAGGKQPWPVIGSRKAAAVPEWEAQYEEEEGEGGQYAGQCTHAGLVCQLGKSSHSRHTVVRGVILCHFRDVVFEL